MPPTPMTGMWHGLAHRGNSGERERLYRRAAEPAGAERQHRPAARAVDLPADVGVHGGHCVCPGILDGARDSGDVGDIGLSFTIRQRSVTARTAVTS